MKRLTFSSAFPLRAGGIDTIALPDAFNREAFKRSRWGNDLALGIHDAAEAEGVQSDAGEIKGWSTSRSLSHDAMQPVVPTNTERPAESLTASVTRIGYINCLYIGGGFISRRSDFRSYERVGL